MDGRAFLAVAQRLAQEATEADWRSAAGRAYYALLQEGRSALERWGFSIPPRDWLHAFVRLRFVGAAHPDCQGMGRSLDELSILRNQADYRLSTPGRFANPRAAQQAVQKARAAITLLDAIEGDAARRTAAVAAVRATLPP
jgi:uncharacterized membrane-anchored protein